MSKIWAQIRENWPIIAAITVGVSVLVSAWATVYIQDIVDTKILAHNELVSPREQQFRLDLAQVLDDAGDNKEGVKRIELKLDKLIDLMMTRGVP